MAVTRVSLLRSEAPPSCPAPLSLLSPNALPRRCRNAAQLWYQSSAELPLARPLGGFPNSRPCCGPWAVSPQPAAIAALQSASTLPAGGSQGQQIELHGHYFQEPLDQWYERQQQRSSWTLNSTPFPIPQQSTFHPGSKSFCDEGESTVPKEQLLPRHRLQQLSLRSSEGDTKVWFWNFLLCLPFLQQHKMLGELVLHWAVPAAWWQTWVGCAGDTPDRQNSRDLGLSATSEQGDVDAASVLFTSRLKGIFPRLPGALVFPKHCHAFKEVSLPVVRFLQYLLIAHQEVLL